MNLDTTRRDLEKHAPKLDDKFRKPTECNRLEAQFEDAAAAFVTGLTNAVPLASGSPNVHGTVIREIQA